MGRRAWLGLLGVAVGCAAVVALLNVGHSAALQSRQLFQGMGSELLVATLQRDSETPAITAQPPQLSAVSPLLISAAPLAMAPVEVRLGAISEALMVTGSTPALATVLDLTADQGRLLSEHDAHNAYLLLGAIAAQQLQASVGDQLQLGRYLFEVIGILGPIGYNPLLPVAVDDGLLIPLQAMRRLSSAPQISAVVALARDSQSVRVAADELAGDLRMQLPGAEVEVQVPQQLLDGMASQARLFSWLLAGLGAIALLVGGVGVMNVMLMSVIERRREIGVRTALGARPVDIAWLFLLEAVILASGGAVLGSMVGVLAAWLFAWLSGWDFALDPWSIPLGVVSALLIGVFFGLQPALAAARLQPVAALRDE
ncbi:ABC transporter permease [Pseudomonas shirazensis]|uniref:ABC transporter permease n=1 Tax=Pseudomonas shirazensis TaxID=2745494 RepID=UPI0039874F05